MDLGYLLRAGLGVPDYWHPHLELQPDFLSGKILRYPSSMDAKADYPGQLDTDGVPVVFWGERREACPSPANIVLYGLGSHDVFLRTKNKRYYEQFRSVLRWLEKHSVPLGTGVGWPHDVAMPVYKLTAPWFSAIVQGLALSLFVRAHQWNGSGPWSALAGQTWRTFQVPVAGGGFCRPVDQGVIYEEYPGPDLDCVFNGMCHALIGLWEAWRSGIVAEAQADFAAGVQGLRSLLPQFNQGRWSLYSLNRCLGKPLLASPYYVRANGVLAQVIGLMADDPLFTSYGERWLKSSESVARRITMSLRIAIDRYRKAPTMLQYDKSKRSALVAAPPLAQQGQRSGDRGGAL
ncbi:MAG: D-glucuronyl C5-epimerase family protein [Candidatus Binatia bacterium]